MRSVLSSRRRSKVSLGVGSRTPVSGSYFAAGGAGTVNSDVADFFVHAFFTPST
jgi:hypothetical protein